MTVVLKYDIDAIRSGDDSPAKVLYRLWEAVGTAARDDLTSAERVLIDAWTFDSTMGNGIGDLIANENYDSIANGLRALRDLSRPRLDQFTDGISRAFESYGIDVATGDSISHLEDLPADKRAALESTLNRCEEPFLDEIWNEGVIIAAAYDYMNEKLDVLRKRKAEQVGGGQPATSPESK